MDNIYNNKYALLNIKPQNKTKFIILILVLFIIVVLGVFKIEIYDNILTKGYVSDDNLLISYVPTNIDIAKMFLNNRDTQYNIIKKELIIDEKEISSYYKLTIKTNKKLVNKEIVNINFYYNKQRIIDKLKEKIF